MKIMNMNLAKDYFKRAKIRRKILNYYLEEGDYPDVIREAQEIVELLLKGMLIIAGIEFPKLHDVGKILIENKDKIPSNIR